MGDAAFLGDVFKFDFGHLAKMAVFKCPCVGKLACVDWVFVLYVFVNRFDVCDGFGLVCVIFVVHFVTPFNIP